MASLRIKEYFYSSLQLQASRTNRNVSLGIFLFLSIERLQGEDEHTEKAEFGAVVRNVRSPEVIFFLSRMTRSSSRNSQFNEGHNLREESRERKIY